MFLKAFIYLKFGFVIFGQKVIGKKAACKMLVKLTTSGETAKAKHKNLSQN